MHPLRGPLLPAGEPGATVRARAALLNRGPPADRAVGRPLRAEAARPRGACRTRAAPARAACRRPATLKSSSGRTSSCTSALSWATGLCPPVPLACPVQIALAVRVCASDARPPARCGRAVSRAGIVRVGTMPASLTAAADGLTGWRWCAGGQAARAVRLCALCALPIQQAADSAAVHFWVRGERRVWDIRGRNG